MCIVDAWGLLCLSCISNMFDDRRLYLINGFFFRGVNGVFFALKKMALFNFFAVAAALLQLLQQETQTLFFF